MHETQMNILMTEGVRRPGEAWKKSFPLRGLLPSFLEWPRTVITKSEQKEGLLPVYYNEHIHSPLRGTLFKKT